MKLLLDTNAYSELKRGHSIVADLVRDAEDIYVSSIVAGELLSGFRYGSRFEENLRSLEEFLASPWVSLIPVTLATAHRFGQISASLRRRGTPIPSNDIWIAAHGFECSAELISFDSHFAAVENLSWRHLQRK